MSVILFSIAFLFNITLFFYIRIGLKRQHKVNASYGVMLGNTLSIFEDTAQDVIDTAKSVEQILAHTGDLSRDNDITKIVCTELINSNDGLSSSIKKLIEADRYNKEKIIILADAFREKAKSDREMMESLKSFLNKSDDEMDDGPIIKKILN